MSSGWLPTYWAEVMGGPLRYSEACGDQAMVLHMHAGNGDLTDLGRRFVACFVLAADDAGLPDDPAFRASLRAYMQWAVDEVVLSYGSPGEQVPVSALDACSLPSRQRRRYSGQNQFFRVV